MRVRKLKLGIGVSKMSKAYPGVIIYGAKQLIGSCEQEVTIDFTRSIETITAIDNICLVFSQAGALGAYASSQKNLVGSTIKYGGLLSTSSESVTVLFSTSNIDFRSLQFFRNMLSKLQNEGITVSRVSVQVQGYASADVFEMPVLTELNESEEYPRRMDAPDNPPLIWEDSEFSKIRRVLIEFGSALVSDQYKQLLIYANAWYALLEMSAFSMPIEFPYDAESFRGSVSIFDEVTYEISINRYISSEIGFDVFANMLGHFSKSVFPIVKIEID